MRKEEFYREALPDSRGPLEGFRVLEATNVAAGPLAGTLLADLGAESVKCEMPGKGDLLRQVTHCQVEGPSELDRSAYYLSINRNKKCITLNLKHPEGQELFRRLARHVDVVIENFKPGTMEGWGLGYQEIRKVKPDIIYTSVSGYGQYGPYSHRPGYDHIGQAMGGLMSITGYPDGPPTKTGHAVADNLGGWQGAFGTLAALVHRMKTGRGQHVDVNLVDAILYTTTFGIMGAANAGWHWERCGNRHPLASPSNTFPCRDGWVIMAVASDSHWAKLCRLMGREALIADPRTASPALRAANWQFVEGEVAAWTQGNTVAEVVDRFEEAGLVASPILSFEEIVQDPHFREREMVAEVEHPTAGPLKLFGVASKYSLTPARVHAPAPLLGQHNEEVYGGWLELTSEEMGRLREKGVI
ncbi:MAG: CoA transferase [Nitrospinae bacterium]|nr:CoA transferase [Nitrospinota bacterium]